MRPTRPPDSRSVKLQLYAREDGMRAIRWIATLLAVLAPVAAARAAEETDPHHRPVAAVGDQRVAVGNAELPVYVSRDWSAPLPGVKRGVLVLHGLLRNADVYFASALKAQAAAGPAGSASLMIAPQFLAGIDLPANHLSDRSLHWSYDDWKAANRRTVRRMRARSARSTRSCCGCR